LGTGDIGIKLIHYLCLLFSISVHEAAHAITADRCGDPSARLLGRATLNPLKHIDPIGTVVMPLLMVFSGFPYLFGWAKPVPFNPVNLRNIRRDPSLIALAGPVSNFLLAITAAILLRIVVVIQDMPPDAAAFENNPATMILFSMVMLNFLLMLFNLIPVPPLDGGHVLSALLPPSAQRTMAQIGPFGIIIAIVIASRFLHGPMNFFAEAVLLFVFLGQG